MLRLILCLGFATLSGIAAVRAQTNLPLGLSADSLVPTELDGYELVELDRKKEIVFKIDGRAPLHAEIPIFIYLPKRDRIAESRDALKAVHKELGSLASQSTPIDPAKLLTLFLAMDRAMEIAEQPVERRQQPVATAAPAPRPPAEVAATSGNPLEQAIRASEAK